MQVFQSLELTPLAGPDNLLLQIEYIPGRLQRNCGWLKLRSSVASRMSHNGYRIRNSYNVILWKLISTASLERMKQRY
ncbi:Uncharacterized protein HZ326_21856 [Fusarium oxysporum f. sp. albedinis]|nr:Uncharacterized protein HZ326_21856 [Fusarium oxysporum f. sp. albedinis]